MPATVDFRTVAFVSSKVDASGKDLGRKVYWKLYAIENLVRVMMHSVLSVQIGPNWWGTAVDPKIQRDAHDARARYQKSPWHSSPGAHEVYYITLWQLNEVVRANRNLFVPLIPDVDQWIARIEQIRLPRNIIGHMNWLNLTDRKRIDLVHSDLQALVAKLLQTGQALTAP